MSKIQLKRSYTQAAWQASTVILAEGEPGVALDTGETRYGNGLSLWANLPSVATTKADAAQAAAIAAAAVDATTKTNSVQGSVTTTAAAAVAAAAPAAVTAALATSPVPQPTAADDPAFTIVDSNGRRSWLEAGTDGHPTSRVVTLLDADLGALTNARVSSQVAALPVHQIVPESASAVYNITDLAGRSVLSIAPDGTVNIPKLGNVAAVTAGLAALTGTTYPIVCWGDSLTAGGWMLQSAIDLAAYGATFTDNSAAYAIGGQTSPSIAARQGGRPALVTLPSNIIPTGLGATTVTVDTIVYSNASSTGTSSGLGSLAGIAGTLTRDNVAGTVTFTRTVDGPALWVGANVPWIPAVAPGLRNKPTIIWSGRNSFNVITPDALVDYIRRMIAYNTAVVPRILVMEIPPWVGEEILPTPTATRVKLDAANAALLAAFPNEFVPVAQYLRGPALAEAGITPTSQDTTDINNGLTPLSLRADSGHPTPQGQALIGSYMARVIRQKGWV